MRITATEKGITICCLYGNMETEMTKEQLIKMGFEDGEFVLRNGLKILVDDTKDNKFCLCTGLDEFFDLTIPTTYDLTQFVKIMGS